jgi:nitrite reductase/ring-hydroxylating ferredoxin subunit
MSGCPSACANHHTADIGLKGVRVKRLLGTREGFDVYLGGGVAGQLQLALPYRTGVDVDQLPNLVDEVVRDYYLRHSPGETFSDYWRRELARRQPAAANEGEFQPPVWECDHCSYHHTGEDPPVYCPECAALRRHFARWEENPAATNGDPKTALTTDGYAMAADLASVPSDRGLLVRLAGNEIALFRVGHQVFAIDNACPHAGGPLADGALEEGCVTCPLHGWTFDVATGARIGTKGFNTTSYPTRIVDGKVLVQVGGPVVVGN